MPDGDGFARLSALVRSYVGPGLDVDVQFLLAASEVPLCHLRSAGDDAPHLGWNSWLHGTDPHARSSDVVFPVEEWDPVRGRARDVHAGPATGAATEE